MGLVIKILGLVIKILGLVVKILGLVIKFLGLVVKILGFRYNVWKLNFEFEVQMDCERIKKQANDILSGQYAECNYIEYKASTDQLPKILKTICAYGNNYADNDLQYIFFGVEEQNEEQNKAVPVLPITGISEGSLERCRNALNSLRGYLYPNVAFEIITNEINDRKYLLIAVPRQTGGPFMVSEKAERDKKLGLKPGRYIRTEAESRLARVDEEYALLRKFANFHFSSQVNLDACADDLNGDTIREYIQKTSARPVAANLSKQEIAEALRLTDKNDPSRFRVKNYALLMFADHPEQFIPYAYTDIIVDMYGTKQKMESKRFTGPIWKQYQAVVHYINDNFLNTFVLRKNGDAENREIANFPFSAVEELAANAFVHNNYENAKPIQIYISESQINIVNYNKPLPPLKLEDLNERRIFNERDTENPEIRDMFKSLGIIESFGTGIGEAKRSLEENGSPQLYYKIFDDSAQVTSVVIPVSEEYRNLKVTEPKAEPSEIFSETQTVKQEILQSAYSENTQKNLLKIYETLKDTVFGNADVMKIINCSQTTATTYLKKLYEELRLIKPVAGAGKGKYRFIS